MKITGGFGAKPFWHPSTVKGIATADYMYRGVAQISSRRQGCKYHYGTVPVISIKLGLAGGGLRRYLNYSAFTTHFEVPIEIED